VRGREQGNVGEDEKKKGNERKGMKRRDEEDKERTGEEV